MTLEFILQKHFGLKGSVFNKNGRLNHNGLVAYKKLIDCIIDVSVMVPIYVK